MCVQIYTYTYTYTHTHIPAAIAETTDAELHVEDAGTQSPIEQKQLLIIILLLAELLVEHTQSPIE
jgi:hypothetical protein